VPRRKPAAPRGAKWEVQLLRALAPEVRQALLSYRRADIKDINTFVLGFIAGRRFQYEQVTKLLCPMCMRGIPVVLRTGVPTHDVPTESGIWRKTCDAHRIYAFKS